MIIYLDEDNSYLSWVVHHRDGFVLDWLRKPTRQRPTLHRATCKRIRVAKSKKTHWTSGRRLKACSLVLEELVDWAQRESGHEPGFCEDCTPRQKRLKESADHGHITRLGREVLDHVVEAAVIHLDNDDADYDLTVQNVAEGLGKTTGQIAGALRRLVQDGYLRLDNAGAEADPHPNRRVYPESKALRMLPAFKKLPAKDVERELALLSGEAE